MHYLTFITAAFLLGCIAAIPVGPVQIEVVRRSINSHLKPSLMVVLGAFIADFFYGTVAFFGIAPFLEEKKIMALFWLSGGLVLTVLGVKIIRHSMNAREFDFSPGHLKRKRWAFIGGIALSAANPLMILWWLSGIRIFTDIGLIRNFTPGVAFSFLVAGSAGLAAYLSALSLFIYRARRFVSFATLRRINVAFGVLLLMLALYFDITSVQTIFP